jgi:hypothetical protein
VIAVALGVMSGDEKRLRQTYRLGVKVVAKSTVTATLL